jgi:xanthine dehydrogenase accessory factor
MIAATPLAILEQALAWAAGGEAVTLVTLVGIEGSASRALGTQMAITATGKHIGSFSGGCIDNAIIGEARESMVRGSGRIVRFGLGSAYIDVRLPCGGGIDLMFTPHPCPEMLRAAIAALHARKPVSLILTPDRLAPDGPGFALRLFPPLRIVVFGQGEDFSAFVRLARTFGASIEGFTPNDTSPVLAGDGALAVRVLKHPGNIPTIDGDPWTAFIFLFHDRDWEDALIPRVLNQPAMYFGAIGSRRTHAARLERLHAKHVDQAALSRLKGHIGLIPATRDPATLAISILAEIAAQYMVACQTEVKTLVGAD